MLYGLEQFARRASAALCGWGALVPAAASFVFSLACVALTAARKKRHAGLSAAFSLFASALSLFFLGGDRLGGVPLSACALFALSETALFSALWFAAFACDCFFCGESRAKKNPPARPCGRSAAPRPAGNKDLFSPDFSGREDKPACPAPAAGRDNSPRADGLRSGTACPQKSRADGSISAAERGGREPREKTDLPVFDPSGAPGGIPEERRAAPSERAAGDPRAAGYRSPADFSPTGAGEEDSPSPAFGEFAEDPPGDLRPLGERRRKTESPLRAAEELPRVSGSAAAREPRLGLEHLREIAARLRALSLSPADEREVRAAEVLAAEGEKADARALNHALAGLVVMMAKYKL